MTTQPALLQPVRTPVRDRIDLRCASCADVDWPEADLVLTDGPWTFAQRFGESAAGDHYVTMPTARIAEVLDGFRAPRLALWMSGAILGEWVRATRDWSWGDITTQGAWGKPGHGQGYHWSGDAEFVLVYHRGDGYNDRSIALSNLHLAPRAQHSRKPARWQAEMVRQWVPEGGLVLDPFVGLGATPEAVVLAGSGRRFLGTEIDPERHTAALALLAQVKA